MSLLPRTGSPSTSTTPILFGELNKNLRKLNDSMCCSLELLPDYEYVPIFEYRQVYAESFTNNPLDRLNYAYGESNDIIFNAITLEQTLASCSGVQQAYSDNITHFEYSDSTGVHILDNLSEYITVTYSNFISKTITGRINIGTNTGFKISYAFTVTTNGSGEPTLFINFASPQSNSNITGGGDKYAYTIKKQDLLEVRMGGVFVKYVKLEDHTDYVPTCYLSYKPVESFTPLDFEIEKPIYNTTEVYYLTDTSGLGTPLVIPANSAHSVSYTVYGGFGTIDLDGTSSITVPVGVSDKIEATTLLNNAITITAPAATDFVAVTVIKY